MGGTSWQAEVGAGNATKKFKALTRAHPQGTLDSTGLNQYHGTLYAYNCIILSVSSGLVGTASTDV